MECGKRAMHLDDGLSLWQDPHCIKLRTNNNRRIACGGLPFDIYIHPNQGESNDEFAISVFPVKSSTEDTLPENYKLSYTVTTTLCSTDKVSGNQDDQKSIAKFDHKWTRDIEDVIYDDNPGSNRATIDCFDWKHHMQRLPFSTKDLDRFHCAEDGQFFDLHITIKTAFTKSPTKRSHLFGVLGAIVLQSEDALDSQKNEIERLTNHRDEYTQSLQSQLQIANKLNGDLTGNLEQFAKFHEDYTSSMDGLQQELSVLATRGRDESMKKEKEISNLQRELADKQEEIQRMTQQMAKLKERIHTEGL